MDAVASEDFAILLVAHAVRIAALTRVKSYLDYGAFTPIQAATCAALNGPQDIVEKNRELYQKRRDVLVESFGRAGWDIPAPRASMFAAAGCEELCWKTEPRFSPARCSPTPILSGRFSGWWMGASCPRIFAAR